MHPLQLPQQSQFTHSDTHMNHAYLYTSAKVTEDSL